VPEAQLVATLTTRSALEVPGALKDVAWLEVRADLVGDLKIETLREIFPGRLLYTLRSAEEGGAFRGGLEARHERLAAAAAAGYDLVDLEVDRDVEEALLAAVPPSRRLLSWHGGPTEISDLRSLFADMAEIPAAFYKLIPEARQAGQELVPLVLLQELKRQDVVAFATGSIGTWTRLLAPRLGAPLVYGAVGEAGAPGQLSIEKLRHDFGLPDLPPVAALFGIVGDPVAHSLSPRLHNAAYRALGLPALYLPFHAHSFGDFWLEVVESEALDGLGFPLRGLSVTAPYKSVALAVAGASSPLAERIGAANTLVWSGGVWEAEATDPAGVVHPLLALDIELENRPALVVGSGGAGRCAAAGLAFHGARVTITNRTGERGKRAAYDLGLPFLPLEEVTPEHYAIVVNATPLGRSDDDPMPLDPARLASSAAVVDMVYRQGPTPWLAACRQRGLQVVDGREVLLFQALRQFQMMTGRELPLEIGRTVLGLEEEA
jgi:3-dehydroquinate dehydratase/shikimate dehydrogenase